MEATARSATAGDEASQPGGPDATMEIARVEAAKQLARGNHESAHQHASQHFKIAMSTYGKGRVELITPCVQLADANVGLHRFGKAADVLALAQWCIVQNPECNHALRSRMHRSMGLLYAAQGKHEAALRHLAQDVYHSALEVGPEHIDTSGGYYAMAGVFYESNQIENALAFYDKVVDVWYKFLASVRTQSEEVQSLEEAALTEAMNWLRRILATRQKFLGETHIATGEARYTLGLLHLFVGENTAAQRNVASAADVYQEHLGADHPSTRDVQHVLRCINDAIMIGASEQGGSLPPMAADV